MKRILSIVLTLAMLLTCFATISFAEDKPTISYYAYWCGSLDPGSYVEKFVEDNLGINIELRKVSHTDAEAVNLMLASDMPDCGWFTQTYLQMEDNELIRTIPVDLVKEYYPSYYAMCEKYPLLFADGLNAEDPTVFNCFSDICESNVTLHNNCIYLRYDWIKKLGIDLGVNVEKLTDNLYIGDKGISRDVFTEVLRQFVNNDPDGNGENDTFGLLKDWPVTLLPSSNILASGNMNVDGNALNWFANPAVKDVLEYIRDLYAEGLIYKEIFTMKWGGDWELIANGKAGVLAGNSVATIWLNGWASNRPPLLLWEKDPTAELIMLPGVAGPDGECHQPKPYQIGRGEHFFVNADVDDEKLIEILKFMEWCTFPKDNDTLWTLWNGEKGVDWDYIDTTLPEFEGFPEDATMGLRTLENGERGTQIFIRNTQQGKSTEYSYLEKPFVYGSNYYLQVGDYEGIWNKYLRYPYKDDIYSTTKAAEIYNEYSLDWQNTYDAYFLKVITGEANLDSDWDEYIKTLNVYKYNEYVEEMNKAPEIQKLVDEYSK